MRPLGLPRVFPAGDEQVIFDRTIKTGYLIPREAAFAGGRRLQLAIEGAARDNITKLIEDLAAELPDR